AGRTLIALARRASCLRVESSLPRAARSLLPLGRRCPVEPKARLRRDGADEGAFESRCWTPPSPARPNDLRPRHQVRPWWSGGVRDRKSWPRVLSPRGEGKRRRQTFF